jgi:hypothetical protein
LQDVFTSGIGWAIFGGLPYDLVNTNPFFTSSDSLTLYSIFFFFCKLIMSFVLIVCSSMFLVNHLASLVLVCMPIVKSKEYEDDTFHLETSKLKEGRMVQDYTMPPSDFALID